MSYEKRQQVKEILKDGSVQRVSGIFKKMPNKHFSFTVKTLHGILSKMVSDGDVIHVKTGFYRLSNENDKQSQNSLFQ